MTAADQRRSSSERMSAGHASAKTVATAADTAAHVMLPARVSPFAQP
jgi:hypothetical protein